MDTTRIQQNPAQTALVNQRVRSFVPGQTISGEIVSRNGNEVQLKLSEDMVLNARVDKNINVEIGQNMTFEIKSNGSTLNLSPLFTNVSTDVNVLKALEMAGLAVTEESVAMTEQLMEAGLPVNKTMLQQIFREVSAYPQASVSDVVNLHKLQIPVNEASLQQMSSYRNLSHQLIEGLGDVVDGLQSTLDSMTAQGDVAGAAKIYQELFLFIQEGGTAQNSADLQETLQNFGQNEPGQVLQNRENGTLSTINENGTTNSAIAQSVRATISGELLGVVENLQISGEEMTALREQILQFAEGNGSVREFCSMLRELTGVVNAEGSVFSDGSVQSALHKLFSGKEFKELLAGELKNLWTITPEEVAEPGKVDELYQRLNRQLKGLSNVLENTGQTESAAFKAVTNMHQNLDFLNQVNQMYAYVQLPLKLQQGDAHGELYVYTNKKKLSRQDGSISALLHLDMEHLGPVDVYVAMQNEKVNTQFYVQDDEMLDFLEGHMDLLTARLQKKGYDCNVSFTSRGTEEASEGGIDTILRQEKGIVLSQYAFDVRT